nr:hypothetical protein [Tanacetum cinerariifolium]
MDIENVHLVGLDTLNHVPVQKGVLQANGVFCRRCTCESCGKGAHIGYNCPQKVLVVYNPEPCHNQNIDELPQTLINFHPTSYTGDENSSAHDSTPNFVNDSPNVFHPPPQTPMNSYEFCGNDAHYSYDYLPQVPKFNRFSFFKTPKVLLLAWDRVFEIKNAVGNKQYKPEDVQELFRKLLNDVQNIHEELAEYINIPSWNHPTFSSHDDDENYTSPITPEELDNSLSMGDEHLDTILDTESDKVIKSSVEDLIPIPNKYEGIPDSTCDAPFHDNYPPLDVSKDQFEELFDYNDDSTSIDNDYFSIDNINYIELSPSDSKLVSLEESPSPFSIPVKDIDSFLEKSDTSLSYSDNSLLEFETFSNHTKEKNSGSTTTHADYSISKYDSFLFEIEPDQDELTRIVILAEPRVHNSGSTTIHADISLLDLECFNFKPEPGKLTSIVDSGLRENVLSAKNVNLPPEDDHSPLFAYVVLIFLSFLTNSLILKNHAGFCPPDFTSLALIGNHISKSNRLTLSFGIPYKRPKIYVRNHSKIIEDNV